MVRTVEGRSSVGAPEASEWTSDVGALTRAVAGPVLLPGDDGYATELAGFDLSVPQRPAVVVGATGAADVIAAVRFAVAQGLRVGVLSTGHGPVRPADGAVLVTTRRMGAVLVDPVRRSAVVQAGATWADVIHESAPFGLAPLSGSSPVLGAVSYTLGGGLGPLGRRYGFAADLVHHVDLVTADGELRRASAEEHPDLFWALRGGGGSFGVVTALRIGLVEVAQLYGGGLFFPGERAPDVLSRVLDAADRAPDELTLSAALVTFPDLPATAAPIRGRYCCHVRVAFCGSSASGEQLIAPLRAAADPLLDTVRPMPFTDVGSIHNDPTTARAVHSSATALRRIDAHVLRTVLAHTGPDSGFMVELRFMGGALAHPPRGGNSVGHRDAAASVYVTAYPAPVDPPPGVAAECRLVAELQPFGTGGALVNFLAGPAVTPEDVRHAYDRQTYDRLVEVKTRWDPHDIVHCNHAIAPSHT